MQNQMISNSASTCERQHMAVLPQTHNSITGLRHHIICLKSIINKFLWIWDKEQLDLEQLNSLIIEATNTTELYLQLIVYLTTKTLYQLFVYLLTQCT